MCFFKCRILIDFDHKKGRTFKYCQKENELKMSSAHARTLVPVGESPRAQKIEFSIPNLKLKKMSMFTQNDEFSY